MDGTVDPLALPAGKVRSYYVAAEEVLWDYAPTGVNGITGQPIANDVSAKYLQHNATRTGKAARPPELPPSPPFPAVTFP